MSDWALSGAALPASPRALKADQLLSDLELDFALQDSERSLQSLRQSSQTLRQELQTLSHKRNGLQQLQTNDSMSSRSPQNAEDDSAVQRLAVEDYVSHEEVLEFLRNYLPGRTQIPIQELLSCLELDFPREMSVGGFAEELARRIAGEAGTVSLNKLQAFTKKDGLTAAVRKLAEELTTGQEDLNRHVNEAIATEIAELSQILEAKTKSLSRRESSLQTRERDFLSKQRKAVAELEASVQILSEKTLREVKSAAMVHVKRLQRLERLLGESVGLKRSKADCESKPRTDETRLKARIVALEKTNEGLKAKVAALEGELNSSKSQVQKLAEDLGKTKAKSQHWEQVAGDYKARLSRETATPKLPETVPEAQETDGNATTEAALALDLFGMLSARLKGGSTASLRSESRPKAVSFGAVLYPFFSDFVPKLTELLPLAMRVSLQATEEIVDLLHSLLSCGFQQSFACERFPANLDFRPAPDVWRRKQTGKEDAATRTALYPLFANQQMQQVAVSYIVKFATLRSAQDEILAAKCAVLVLLLSSSEKRLEGALRGLKTSVSSAKVSEFLLSDPSRSLLPVLVTMKSDDRATATMAGEIALALTVQRDFAALAKGFNGETSGFSVVAELAERALSDGERSDFEDYLVLLLQKLVSAHVLTLHKRDPLTSLLITRARALQPRLAEPEVKFILENMSSILQHAK